MIDYERFVRQVAVQWVKNNTSHKHLNYDNLLVCILFNRLSNTFI